MIYQPRVVPKHPFSKNKPLYEHKLYEITMIRCYVTLSKRVKLNWYCKIIKPCSLYSFQKHHGSFSNLRVPYVSTVSTQETTKPSLASATLSLIEQSTAEKVNKKSQLFVYILKSVVCLPNFANILITACWSALFIMSETEAEVGKQRVCIAPGSWKFKFQNLKFLAGKFNFFLPPLALGRGVQQGSLKCDLSGIAQVIL